jgi:hypothetical protein
MSIGARPPHPPTESVDSDEYYAGFRKKVFKLLKLGYDRLDAPTFNQSEEPDITGELVRHIRQVIEDRSAPSWAWHFAVHDDPPVNVPSRRGKRRSRLDIELELARRGQHPRYPFEAKRLCAGGFGATKYIGQGGLQDFLSGKYARNQCEAGMLGYVQSHTEQEWATRIKRQFERAIPTTQICAGGEWSFAHEIKHFDYCYHSKHNRPSVGKPITIYHCLLRFCQISQLKLFDS